MNGQEVLYQLRGLVDPDDRRDRARQASQDFIGMFDENYFDDNTEHKVNKLNKALTEYNGEVPRLVRHIIKDLKKSYPHIHETTPFTILT